MAGGLAAACKEDLQTYCANVTAGEARIAFCMLAHEDKISAKCVDALVDVADKIEMKMSKLVRLSLACEDDLNKNCDAVRAGKGRLVQCIRDQKDRLSDGCKAELGE
jgi:Golgi apparatus protein 1